ncbi:MAG: DUF6033 family protein [Lachnospiraceae bacterium]|nr:DUF6033 family protein [Lachnospiraceae bacterium]
MVGMNGISAYAMQTEISKKNSADNAEAVEKAAGKAVGKTADKSPVKSPYGKTVGEPKLSEKAQKYYDQLKKRYGNYDFILVSKDEKENAKANAAKYANKFKTVVLIDEEKIEKMATDENYRKKYEGILSGATAQLQQLKDSMAQSGANVKGYGMQVDDNGTASYFAVLKKSSADQKARIEKKAAASKAEKKAADKKAAAKQAEKRATEKKAEKIAEKKAGEERIKEARNNRNNKPDFDDEDTVTISANSIEDLMKKFEEYNFNELSNSVMTESEKQIGQNIDFRG